MGWGGGVETVADGGECGEDEVEADELQDGICSRVSNPHPPGANKWPSGIIMAEQNYRVIVPARNFFLDKIIKRKPAQYFTMNNECFLNW